MHVSFAQIHKQFIEKKKKRKVVTLIRTLLSKFKYIKVPQLLKAHCPLLMPTVVLILSVTIIQLLSLRSLMVKFFEADYLKKRGTPGVCVESGQSKTWTPISYFNLLEWDFGCSQY